MRLVRLSQIVPKVAEVSHNSRHHLVKCHEFVVALSNSCFVMKCQRLEFCVCLLQR